MAKTTHIGYPKHDSTTIWRHPTDKKAKFIAHGIASADVDGQNLRAKLLRNGKTDTGTKTYFQPPTASQPFWIIIFTGVDPTTGTNDSYRLEVWEGDTHRLAHSDNLQVEVSNITPRGITLVGPLDDAQVCPSFAAYGRYDSGTNITCQLTKNAVPVPSTPVQTSQGLWVASFIGITEDVYDTLQAQVDNDLPITSNNITVNAMYCALETAQG